MTLQNPSPRWHAGRGQVIKADVDASLLPAPAAPSKKVRKRVTVSAALALLAERWPKAFAVYEGRRRPLKVGIHNDMLPALAGAITPTELAYTLACYVNNERYLRACSRAGAARIDLNGALAGHVTPEQANHARFKLSEMTIAWMKAERRS